MVNSALEQYQIADFLEWHQAKNLARNPYFQRGRVWAPGAKIDLIDTILRRFPMPKIYLRQRVNLETRTSYREIVDGQQRISAILDFAEDKIVLNKRAKEFAGLRYSTLDPEYQETFLSYPIAVEQLVNASDDDVLEVFARLNSYTVPLNRQELRHAKFSGDFKWAVNEAARRWSILWERFEVISPRERVRMADDQLMAELFGVIINGVTDGGQPNIDKLYARMDQEFADQDLVMKRLDAALSCIADNFAGQLLATPVLRAPHFLMLFAAVAHALFGLPEGGIGGDLPARSKAVMSDLGLASQNLVALAKILDTPEQEARELRRDLYEFRVDSSSSTQRIRSRKPRFLAYYRALHPEPL